MRLADVIQRDWNETGRFKPIYRTPTIEDGEGLMLGAGTRLLNMRKDRDGHIRFSIEEECDRLIALLSVANAGASIGSYKAIRKATDCWARGETCLAEIHLALAGFRELSERDAYRLFAADGVLAAGCAPATLMKALNLSPVATGVRRAANESRIPAGNGRTSGEWAMAGGGATRIEVVASRKPLSPEYRTGDYGQFFDTLEPKVRNLAQSLNIDETWLLGLAAYESGWLCRHNRSLNDPFGETKAGGDDLHYASMDAAINAWERNHGAAVRGATTAEDFAQRLKGSHYNTDNPLWLSGVIGTIQSVRNRLPKWSERNHSP